METLLPFTAADLSLAGGSGSHRKPPQQQLAADSLKNKKPYIALLQSCIDADSIAGARRLHSEISGAAADADSFVGTKLVSAYAKCGSLEDARKVFDGMPVRNVYTWTAMINAYSRAGRWEELLRLFAGMSDDGLVPDAFLITRVLQACANVGDMQLGKMIHAVAVRLGMLDRAKNVYAANAVLAMYAKCGELRSAGRFLEKMRHKDVVSWNSVISGHCQFGERDQALRMFELMREEGIEPGVVTWNVLISSYSKSGDLDTAVMLMEQMKDCGVPLDVFTWTSVISGFVQNDRAEEAFDFFAEMRDSGVEPNGMTLASLLTACALLGLLRLGKQLHCVAVKTGCAGSVLFGNSMIDMYAKCGSLVDAQRGFDAMKEKDVFSWNSMIAGYAQAGFCGRAFELFSEMETRPNAVSWNAMMSAYMRSGDEDRAAELFERMEADGVARDTAAWNVMIAGSVQNGNADGALRFFRRMQAARATPNAVTVLSILPALGNLLSASKVREMHGCILRRGLLEDDASVANALVDAYAKSGELGCSRAVFDRTAAKDIISWNSMIAASILHGDSDGVVSLFRRMTAEGVRPDSATIAGLIRAYALGGMVPEGLKLFLGMSREYNVSPSSEHYAAIVELFGRSGRLREASSFVDMKPVAADAAVWDALLTASCVHGNRKLARKAAENLLKARPNDLRAQRLILPARKKDDEHSNPKAWQCSCWLGTGNGGARRFSTGAAEGLERAVVELENGTAAPDSGSDLDGAALREGIHCEMLAVAFGFSRGGVPRWRGAIRVIKSQQMCRHCHAVMKSASARHRREVMIKDPRCLHKFRDGGCSCRDYW